MKKKTNKKFFKNTVSSVILFVVIVVIYVEFNIFIEKINIPEVDLSKSKLYSITETSKNLISSIEKNVVIELYNFDEYLYVSNISNVVDVIKKYPEINKNIVVEQKNSKEYEIPVVIVKCEDNTSTLTIEDLFTYIYSTDTYTEEDFDITEQKITNAILDVTEQDKNKVYIYITHSAYKDSIQSTFSTLITEPSRQLNQVYLLDLSTTKKIPDECSVFIIPTIQEDINEDEKNEIINYINKGGNILLLQESRGILNTDTPNFNEILNLYGVSISDGVLMEENEERKLNGIPGFIISKINNHSQIGNLLPAESKVVAMDAGKINFKDDDTLNSLNVSYEIIASTSDNSYLRNDLTNNENKKNDNDEFSPNSAIIALVSKKIDEKNNSEMIIFSNSVLATDSIISLEDSVNKQVKNRKAVYMNNNQEVIEHSVKYLAKNNKSIILRKKYYDNIPTLNLIKNSGIVQLLFGIPMLIILIGYIVWRIRKNKK